MREEPESGLDHGAVGDDSFGDVGQLVDSDTMTDDREEQAVADAVPEVEEAAEEAAMHIIDEGSD
jgi:hypothetical protein